MAARPHALSADLRSTLPSMATTSPLLGGCVTMPVGKLQKAPEPRQFGLRKGGHAHRAVRAAEDGAERHHEEAQESMVLVPRLARVRDMGEVGVHGSVRSAVLATPSTAWLLPAAYPTCPARATLYQNVVITQKSM